MGRVDGKVALITGAARGQGRSHAVRLAGEGADIIAVDRCRQLETVRYPMATPADLAETARLVEQQGRRVLAREADVRDLPRLREVVAEGLAGFGRLDIVVANAGIGVIAPVWEITEDEWRDMFDVNLTGVWKTVTATVPALIEQGEGGSIILTSSLSGLIAEPNLAHYTAAKHGVNGLMKVLAQELAPHFIRVNSVNPCTVDTPMIQNETIKDLFNGGRQGATEADFRAVATELNALPLPWIDAADVSNAVVHLACDESRYVTGIVHVIDAGAQSPAKVPGRTSFARSPEHDDLRLERIPK
ncbi:mycofactocin-coupled SDR family oxidoreductase [Amycolatopsis pithecellobii]|uniref:Mycofactocin-coupled SDR family oxidoreductase n=1 Tax=Amycolatopsis pithecellobii TaxID=664692 RepID=A0A6N7YXE4_9PSEU|nr:mycofactocin-coupled SDR family oxidoreductase [Amycolatopsis pithecellobii]MTD56602.1 mycofactocin-coupled SDR family oxidoreductase [Amycolatopsis pithecellobii]